MVWQPKFTAKIGHCPVFLRNAAKSTRALNAGWWLGVYTAPTPNGDDEKAPLLLEQCPLSKWALPGFEQGLDGLEILFLSDIKLVFVTAVIY